MTKNELEVFLSSDQNEFVRMRKPLSEKICSIRYLTCTPLENRGADTINIVESSLKAVRDSDLYVGIFGGAYSDITIKEYREAVKHKKPCLTYVRKVKKRDNRLSEFIEQSLQNEFKYSTFRGLKDLTAQIETDLNRFILDTLRLGLDERGKKKEEAMALIKKEEKAMPEVARESDPFVRAELAFNNHNYTECLVMTTVALEASLQKALKTKNINAERKGLGELIQRANAERLLNTVDFNRLREISHFRNAAVHLGETPDRKTIEWVLSTAKSVLNRLESNGYRNESDFALAGLELPKEVEEFIKRRKPNRAVAGYFRLIIRKIEELPRLTSRTIKETVVSYKTTQPFVSVELRKTRILLHLTLPKEPKEQGIEYLRSVYGNMMHGHFSIRRSEQVYRAIDVCRKAYYASIV